jgi:hypothetical protein
MSQVADGVPAVGMGRTVMGSVCWPVAPLLSVTVTVTAWTFALEKVFAGFCAVLLVPSPKLHA